MDQQITESNVRLLGRCRVAEDGVVFNWTGSGILFRFYGTDAAVMIEHDEPNLAEWMPYLSILLSFKFRFLGKCKQNRRFSHNVNNRHRKERHVFQPFLESLSLFPRIFPGFFTKRPTFARHFCPITYCLSTVFFTILLLFEHKSEIFIIIGTDTIENNPMAFCYSRRRPFL